MSAAVVTSPRWPATCSGAMYEGVPENEPGLRQAAVVFNALGKPEIGDVWHACSSSRILDGFRSRCNTPRRCA